MEQLTSRLGMRALMVNSDIRLETADGRAARALADELRSRHVRVIETDRIDDGAALARSDAAIQAVIVDWDTPCDGNAGAASLIGAIRARSTDLPIFVSADRTEASSLPLEVLSQIDEFVWSTEDTPAFISGRVVAAIERYRDAVLPPMFKALATFARVHEYSWHTPGHTGGTAFLKHPAGRAFFEFFGENLFRSDLSISVGELGSLLDHTAAIGEGERYAARVFGAHRTYSVTNGSSTSNRVILMASVTRNQVALCDRNCHKSAEHAMTLSGAIPTWLLPSRNGLGIIGPIPPSRLAPHAIERSVAENPLVRGDVDPAPVHAIITNSTYDGLCYDVARVETLLGETVDRLHFDEAWYGYGRFNPLYAGRHAMHGDPAAHDGTRPTVFATQSTHKLLAALSQASFIHVRDGRRAIPHGRFNEAFMMHASTSPNYAIIASNDVTAAMMDGPSGPALTGEAIREAIAFRQTMARMAAEYATRGSWFFTAWQPETAFGRPFHAADPERLATDPSAWVLAPGAAWHGFEGMEEGWCLLDPIKVSVLSPGMAPDGTLAAEGIPAGVVTAYLARRGIVVEKTTDFTILFLFSIGVTKGEMGLARQRLRRVQARLRRKRGPRTGASRPRRALPRPLPRHGPPRPRGHDVRRDEAPRDHRLDGGRLLRPAARGADTDRRLRGARPRRGRARPASRARRPRRRDGRRSVPAGHPAHDARRERRSRRRAGGRLSSRPRGLRRRVSGVRSRHPRRRGGGGRLSRPLCHAPMREAPCLFALRLSPPRSPPSPSCPPRQGR
jgi:arginine/lysine/ornithine decarboxylase